MAVWKRWAVALGGLAVLLLGSLMVSSSALAGGATDSLTFSPAPPSSLLIGDTIGIQAQLTWSSPASPVTPPTGESITMTGPGGATCTAQLQPASTADTETALCDLTPEQAGNGEWTISYPGDSDLPAQTASSPVTITKGQTTTGLTASPTSIQPGGSVQLIAEVNEVRDSNGSVGPVENGEVTFYSGTPAEPITGCSDIPITLNSVYAAGEASALCTTTGFDEAGTVPLTAVYNDTNQTGTTNYGDFGNSTSSPVTETITPFSTATQIIQTPASDPAQYSTGTFVAKVSPEPDSGTVSFAGDSAIVSACSNIPIQSGEATCTLALDSAGSLTVTASYSGDTNYTASTSTGQTITVVGPPAGPNVTLTANSVTLLTPLTLTATLKSPTGASLAGAGTVEFDHVRSVLDGGPLPICVDAPVSADGRATCTFASYIDRGGPFEPSQTALIESFDASFTSNSPSTLGNAGDGLSSIVTLVPTKITVSAPSHPVVGHHVVVTAKVSPIPTVTYTPGFGGEVTTTANLVEIHFGTGSCQTDVSDQTGIASCTFTPSNRGTYVVSGDYFGTPVKPHTDNAKGIWARSKSKHLKVTVTG